MNDRIAALARRVRDDPFFLAAALRDFAQSEELDEAGLAGWLACPVATLAPLSLCRRPRPDPPHFLQDIDRIVTRFSVRADHLAEAVRRADALAALRQEGLAARGTLMAARDREEPLPRHPAGKTEPEEGSA